MINVKKKKIGLTGLLTKQASEELNAPPVPVWM